MKKLLLIFFLSFLIYLSNFSFSFASTIYFNNLNGSLSDFKAFWGPCSTGPSGLVAGCGGGLLYIASNLNSIACVQGDYDELFPNVNNGLFIVYAMNNNSWIYGMGIFNENNSFHFREANPISGVWSSWDSGIAVPSGIHTYNTCTDGSYIYFFEDGSQLFSHPLTYSTSYDSFAINAGDSSFANIIVSNSLPDNIVLGSSPTPTPTPIQLSVPVVKQSGPTAPWRNATYDLATIWSPTNYTIGTWGCALTAADMILKYYGINFLPGNGTTPLTPGTLDAWLGVQPDGYIPNGNVNWLAISRLSKLAKTNNSTLLDALEYQRSNFADTTNLLSDLQANHPDILEEPGHFVVATGKNTSGIYTINDPYYPYADLSSYGNSFLTLGRFIPSFTDLSYILFTSDPSLTVTLKDNNGNPVGTSYTQQPLSGAGTALSAGNPINILYLQKPGTGDYTLTISGTINQLYTIKGFLYDVNGNVKPFSQTGTVDPGNPNSVAVHFDGQNLTNDTAQKIVTIATFLSDLNDLYQLKYVKQGAYEPLKNLGQNVQNAIQKHNTLLVKIDLGVLKTLLGIDKSTKLLTDTAYQILLTDVQYLQSH